MLEHCYQFHTLTKLPYISRQHSGPVVITVTTKANVLYENLSRSTNELSFIKEKKMRKEPITVHITLLIVIT